jgi:hypothetical protein
MGASWQECIASTTDFTNFSYQVEMYITKGSQDDGGGIIFRAENAGESYFYHFDIHRDGSYVLYASYSPIQSGQAPNFNTSLNQYNLIGVVAQDNMFSIYINGQVVVRFQASSYSHGAIGVLAYEAGNSIGDVLQVLFSNAQVWVP